MAFLHVPSSSADDVVAAGRDVVLRLIRAICESDLSRGRKPGP